MEDCGVSPEETCIQPAVEFINQLDGLSASTKHEYIEELNRKKSLCLMGCGVTGVGKSTLLNGISGYAAFEVGDQLQHQTTRIDKFNKIKDVCSLNVYDTPGFNDCTDRDEDYVKKMQTECLNVDVLLYCIKVDKHQPDFKPDKLILEKLKAALNPEVWKHCVIVLTFANRIVTRLEQKNKGNIAVDFKKTITFYMSEVHKILKELEICPEPDKIPIVPAGLTTKPSLLQDSDYWFSELFYAIGEVSPPDGQVVLTVFNNDRMKSRNQVNYHKEFEDELYKQPILLPKETWKDNFIRKFPIFSASLGAGAGGAGGIAGAGIGALIGTFAIGLPTFGAAAGVGFVLGGAIGGASGAGIGILVAQAATRLKKKKNDKDSK